MHTQDPDLVETVTIAGRKIQSDGTYVWAALDNGGQVQVKFDDEIVAVDLYDVHDMNVGCMYQPNEAFDGDDDHCPLEEPDPKIVHLVANGIFDDIVSGKNQSVTGGETARSGSEIIQHFAQSGDAGYLDWNARILHFLEKETNIPEAVYATFKKLAKKHAEQQLSKKK